jgi:glycosyltransferase involved in cell wall biosynthesis
MNPVSFDLMYVIVDNGPTLDNSPVFQSQVLDRIRVHCEAGLRIGVIANVSNEIDFDMMVRAPLEKLGVSVFPIPDKGLTRNLICANVLLRRCEKKTNISNVYVRGIWGAFAYLLAYPLFGPRFIYDFRGDLVAEAAGTGASAFRQELLRLLCRVAFYRASPMLTVSKASIPMLMSDFGCSNVVVFPSSVDFRTFQIAAESRDLLRKKLNFEQSDVVLVYAGGLSHYQMIPEMLRIWLDLSRMPNIHFLLLTSWPPDGVHASLLSLVKKIPRLMRISVPRSEVPGYLAASDIGFLLRDDDPINTVASPVKFGEYIASGLAVVTSPGVGDISCIVTARNIGVLVRPRMRAASIAVCEDLISRFISDREGFRQRAYLTVKEEKWDYRDQVRAWEKLLFLKNR